jgi:hypothetical protein
LAEPIEYTNRIFDMVTWPSTSPRDPGVSGRRGLLKLPTGSGRSSPLRACRVNPLYQTGSNAEDAADFQDAHAAGFKLAHARLYGRLTPVLRPFALARARPAFTLSRMTQRSNSANRPSIWNIAMPAVVDVSSPLLMQEQIDAAVMKSLQDTEQIRQRST